MRADMNALGHVPDMTAVTNIQGTRPRGAHQQSKLLRKKAMSLPLALQLSLTWTGLTESSDQEQEKQHSEAVTRLSLPLSILHRSENLQIVIVRKEKENAQKGDV